MPLNLPPAFGIPPFERKTPPPKPGTPPQGLEKLDGEKKVD
jgi:hypothetical protein